MDNEPKGKGLAILLGMGKPPDGAKPDGDGGDGHAAENEAASSPECVAAASDVMEALHGSSAKDLSNALGDWMDLYQNHGSGSEEPDGDEEKAAPEEAPDQE